MTNKKKEIMKNQTKNDSFSRFWMGDDEFSFKPSDDINADTLIKLATYRRAIASFVKIVSNKDIPVKFSTGLQSYTDGETVVLSAKFDKNEYDVNVGLALHEASHILLTDFKDAIYLVDNIDNNLELKGLKIGLTNYDVKSHVKILTNWIEDRRIDFKIFKSSPGYKGYYHKLYEKYFLSPSISKALLSGSFRSETWENYQFRVLNLINPNTDLSALVGLRKIAAIIDLDNINRLTNVSDSFNIACDVLSVVYDTISNPSKNNTSEKTKKVVKQIDNSVDGEDLDIPNVNPNAKDDTDDDGVDTDSDDDDTDSDDDDTDGGSDKKELSKSKENRVKKEFDKIKDLINNTIKKTKINDNVEKALNTIEQSNTKLVEVGKGFGHGVVDCIVVGKITKSLIDSNTIPILNPISNYSKAVNEGERLGTILGKKLKLREDERTTIFSRLESGKIDKRLLYTLGFDNTKVFYNKEIDKYNPTELHLSIDASSSMRGCWDDTMMMLVAICKATSMVSNLRTVVSFRSTVRVAGTRRRSRRTYSNHQGTSGTNSLNHKSKPLVVIAYDSKVDKFSKVKSLFKHICANGETPEGLAFEVISDIISAGNVKLNSHFVNISDGEPCFHNFNFNYSGESAFKHTQTMVNNMRMKGINILSYFLSKSEFDDGSGKYGFKIMYGKDAKFIKSDSIVDISRTMNEMFLTK